MDSQMRLINTIASTNSRREKEKLLAKVEKNILLYAYHPDKRYYLTSTPSAKTVLRGETLQSLSRYTWRVLDVLSSGKYRGQKALTIYNNYMATLTPMSGELFNRILDKDLKCGVSVKTINNLYPGLVPVESCMLCTDIDMHKVAFPCYSSIKIDGDRAVFTPDKGFASRTGKKITGLEHLEQALQGRGHIVDGELRDNTLSCSRSSGLIRSNLPHKPNVHYFVFDVDIRSALPLNKRLDTLRTLYTLHPHIHVVPHILCHDSAHVELAYKAAIKVGHEGTVVKTYDHIYQFKRSADWMRLVPVSSADVEVVDITHGKRGSKYEGKCGALVVVFHGEEQKVGSGLSDNERELYANDHSLIVGEVIEVEYKGLTDHGKMRQPRYKRIRTDKIGV